MAALRNRSRGPSESVNNGGNARPHLLRISGPRKSVVAVTGGKLQTLDSGAGLLFKTTDKPQLG